MSSGENSRLSIAVYAPDSQWDHQIQHMIATENTACIPRTQNEAQSGSLASINSPPSAPQQPHFGDPNQILPQSQSQNPPLAVNGQQQQQQSTTDDFSAADFDPFGVDTPSQQVPNVANSGDSTPQAQADSHEEGRGQSDGLSICDDEAFYRFLVDVTEMLG